MWVLGGRTDTNRGKLKRILSKSLLHVQVFHLCYNMKQMQQYGHFKRARGIANSRSHELLFLCYKGRQPKQLAKMRAHVDGGSPVFNEVVRNVPVLPQKNHALVSRDIRDASLQTMIGVCVSEVEAKDPDYVAPPPNDDEDAATAEGADAATAAQEKAMVQQAIKRRKLYRQVTGTEVPWFPHDNDIELLKELCHEAGRPRWVYFGTPAGGAGIHGCIEMGCSVLALCYDDHHRKHLGPFLVQRAVEAMLGSNTMVFHNESLVARAKELRLTKEETKDDKKDDHKEKEKEKEKKDEKKKENKKEKKEEKKKEEKNEEKRKTKPKSSSSDSDSEPTSSEENTPKKKKTKTEKA